MRATDVIRDLLNVIDSLESKVDSDPLPSVVDISSDQPQTDPDLNRFKHIFTMLDLERSNPVQYANSPNEVVAPMVVVTKDAGGGWNGPKNPADLRGNSISLYPNYLHKPGQ